MSKEILSENIDVLKEMNKNESEIILKIIEAYDRKTENEKTTILNSSINKESVDDKKIIINLDKINADKYFYTKMRLKMKYIKDELSIVKLSEQKDKMKYCKKILKHEIKSDENLKKDCIDIAEYINSLEKIITGEEKILFVANNIDEENVFKEEQIKKAIEVLKHKDLKERLSIVYDEVCDYLDEDFIKNNFCDFKNDKCIAQRRMHLYPLSRRDGCCSDVIKKCKNLNCGKCEVKCLPCKLFSCPYLTEMGIGYWASEIVLIKAFFTSDQRRHLVNDFYEEKEKIMEKVMKRTKITKID